MGLGDIFRRPKIEPRHEGDPDAMAGMLDESLSVESDDIGELLSSFEALGLEVFERYGLPSAPGAYKRSPSGEWQFLATTLKPGDRWNLILESPPEEGWRYAKLADIGRQMMPHQREVMAAVRLFEAVDEARREAADASGGFDLQKGSALKAGMRLVLALDASARFSRQKLYASPIRDGDGNFSAAHLLRRNLSEERQKLWKVWRAEAAEIWRVNPAWGSRTVAIRLKKSLGLHDSVHTIRRRILVVAPSSLAGETKDGPSR